MYHITPLSRTQMPARGEVTMAESLVLLVLQIFFYDWTNFSAVSRNLSKFYEKT